MLFKHIKKKLLPLCISTALIFPFLPSLAPHAEDLPCAEYTGSNIEAQDYLRWSSPVKSYLEPLAGGSLLRVQAGGNIKGIIAEYYDSAYNLTAAKRIPEELPIFGGFYASDSHYFLVTGQQNPNESKDVAVFRITKYDKSWNRLGQAELKDCNTTVPFDAGSLRMDRCGKYLLIRTSHEMYKSDDGYNHQANVTIELDMENMTITDSFTRSSNNSMGYVSHSFNQFLKIEDNHIVALDHGDAYPRSLVLLKYATDVSTGTFQVVSSNNRCTAVDILKFPGAVGQNVTGAAVGGFELSASSYLTAGHSVVQNDKNLTNTTRNVFVAATDKATSAVTLNWLTSYAEGDGTTSTPQMVKLSDTEFLVLWSRDNTVYYTKVDDKGIKTSEIYSHSGNLSDCVPIVSGGKIIWYTWKDNEITFYELDRNNLSQYTVITKNTGHQYECTGVANGNASLKCTKCHAEAQVPVITQAYTWWKTSETGSTSSSCEQKQRSGNKLYYQIGVAALPSSGLRDEIEVVSSDPSIVSVSRLPNSTGSVSSTQGGTTTTIRATFFNGCLTMKNAGTATVTIRSRYNPSVSSEYTFQVGGETSEPETQEPETQKPGISGDKTPNNPGTKVPAPANPAQPSVSKGASVKTKAGIFKVTKAGGRNTAEAAFTGMQNSAAKKLTIPASVTINGVSCKVTSIAPKAFRKKTKLTKVTIGKNVKTIGKDAFNGCRKLKTITIKSTVLKSVGKNAIKGIHKKAVIKVPKRKRAAYKKLFRSSTGFKKTMKI